MAMREGVSELTLDLLNSATQAWVEHEYRSTRHCELDATPLARFLEGPTVIRECPHSQVLRGAFRMELTRTQRRSDGTVSLEGRRFEIPSRYRHLQPVSNDRADQIPHGGSSAKLHQSADGEGCCKLTTRSLEWQAGGGVFGHEPAQQRRDTGL